MKLSKVKNKLKDLDKLVFQLPNGSIVPEHFHVTEVGVITKDVIDCGGTVRSEKVANFQLWSAEDHDHRLAPQKLISIIELSEKVLGMEDLPVEVEFQSDTIGKYGLDFDGENFLLTTKQTDCLAKSNCGIPAAKTKVKLSDLSVVSEGGSCTPGGGCC